jgi:hypothetical protein
MLRKTYSPAGPYVIGWHAFPVEDGIGMLLNNIELYLFSK